METGNFLGFQTLCHMIVFLGRGSHPGNIGAHHHLLREIQLVQVLPPHPHAHGTQTHTRTRFLVTQPEPPNPVLTEEVSSPGSKRNNRAPESCAYISTNCAARNSTVLSLLGKSWLAKPQFPHLWNEDRKSSSTYHLSKQMETSFGEQNSSLHMTSRSCLHDSTTAWGVGATAASFLPLQIQSLTRSCWLSRVPDDHHLLCPTITVLT